MPRGFGSNCWQKLNLVIVLVLLRLSGSRGSWSSSEDQFTRIVFANRGDISLLSFSHDEEHTSLGQVTRLVEGMKSATTIAIHYDAKKVCWSDIDLQKIQCSRIKNNGSFNPSNRNSRKTYTTIASRDLPAMEDLACDFVTSKLYWSDQETSRIEVVTMDPPYYRKVLIWNDDVVQPRAISLAPNLGYLFWSDWGENPKIEKSGMDGSERSVLVQHDIVWPNGLAVDLFKEVLYWIDAKLRQVSSINFDGSNRKILDDKATLHPFALTFSNDFLYWSDWSNNSIHQFSIRTKKHTKIQTHRQIPLHPMDLVVLEKPNLPVSSRGWKTNATVEQPCKSAGCSHMCLLSPRYPFYRCVCPTGIKLINQTHCANEIEDFLIVSKGSDIRKISLDTTDYSDTVLPLNGIRHVLAVDYDVESRFLYWADGEAKRIRRAKLDGSRQEDVIKSGIDIPDGLAIDWVAKNLYWSDAGTERIEMSRIDGSYRRTIISRGLDEPRAVNVEPVKGYLFWTDWGRNAKIERSYLDGSSRIVIVNEDVFWPNGLAIDYDFNKIYWSDAKSDKIEMSNYDGSSRKVLLSDSLPHIFGFSLLGDYLYWTDWQERVLERANKITGKNRTLISDSFSDPMGLKAVSIYSPNLNFTNPCKFNNGGCEQLCFFNPEKTFCACSTGYELSGDDFSCSVPNAFLLFSQRNDIRRISLNRSVSSNRDYSDLIHVSRIKTASALDFHAKLQQIYWCDTKMRSISVASLNGSYTGKVIEYGLLSPEGIAMDWYASNLYWTDSGRNRIEVSKLNGDFRRTLIWNGIEHPKSIVLEPTYGWMYFTVLNGPSIQRAALDGTRRSAFIDQIGRPGDLAIDPIDRYIYWTDLDSELLVRTSLAAYRPGNEKKKEIILKSSAPFKPMLVALHKDSVYLWDDASHGIYKMSKRNAEASKHHKIYVTSANLTDMAVFSKDRIPNSIGQSACRTWGCSHLCFDVPNEKNGFLDKTLPVCGCPTHYLLEETRTVCLPPTQFLLLSTGMSISRLILDSQECPDAVVIGGALKHEGINSISWDFNSRVIYYVDRRSNVIKKGPENGAHGPVPLPSSELTNSKPFSLAYDHMRNLLFWTCETHNSINVSNPDGITIGAVISKGFLLGSNLLKEGMDFRPRHLALDPEKGYLYFSNGRDIERILEDGMERKVIVEGSSYSRISGLTLDLTEKNIYWSDSYKGSLEMVNFEGKDGRVLVPRNLDQPGPVAVMGRYLYFIEKKENVRRIEKRSGSEKLTVLPALQSANFILSVNDSLSRDMLASEQYRRCRKLRCSQICLNMECSCFEGFALSPEDKKTCVTRLPCGPHKFKCVSGKTDCIPFHLKCDGVPDCADKSDEADCPKPICTHQCPCETPGIGLCIEPICLSDSQMCDGIQDCPGSDWDESEEMCSSSSKTGRTPADPSSPSSTLTVVFIIVLVILTIVMCVMARHYKQYCRRSRLPSEESILNPIGCTRTRSTTMTTVNSVEFDRFDHSRNRNGSSRTAQSPCTDLLVPHPSPATVRSSSYFCRGSYPMYCKPIEQAPPPTPCSTDVCDSSDIYASFAPPPSPHTASPQSTIRSGGGLYPPPPSPNVNAHSFRSNTHY